MEKVAWPPQDTIQHTSAGNPPFVILTIHRVAGTLGENARFEKRHPVQVTDFCENGLELRVQLFESHVPAGGAICLRFVERFIGRVFFALHVFVG